MTSVTAWLEVTEKNYGAISETIGNTPDFWKRRIGRFVGWSAGRAAAVISEKPEAPYLAIDDNYFFRNIYRLATELKGGTAVDEGYFNDQDRV